MKPSFFLRMLIFILFLNPGTVFAQLTQQEQASVKYYFDRNSVLSRSNVNLDRIFNDQAVITSLKNCISEFREYEMLGEIMMEPDIIEMYSKLGVQLAEKRNIYMPVFNKVDFKNVKFGLDKEPGINSEPYASLINQYNVARIADRMTPENAFGSMQIINAEKMEGLRKEASSKLNIPVNDQWINWWLEMKYYDKVRSNAVEVMTNRQRELKKKIQGECASVFLAKVGEENKKPENTPQNWTGTFKGEYYTITLTTSANNVKGNYEIRLPGQVEAMQWELMAEGGTAKGKWTLFTDESDRKSLHKGTVTVNLKDDDMEYDMLYTDEPVVTWKEGSRPKEQDKLKGSHITGTLKRIK